MRFLGLGVASIVSSALYVTAVEPFILRRIKRNQLTLPNWPNGLKLRVALLSDIHACEPWMSAKRLSRIVASTNELGADIVLLLGDYLSSMDLVTGSVSAEQWSAELGRLKAPLGVHAILGNHDWWADKAAQERQDGPTLAGQALEAAGIKLYENDATRLEKDGSGFWIAGLGDQLAFPPYQSLGRSFWRGRDDLDATLSKVISDEPILLMAHEPDIFPQVSDRVSLTLSGHTHGGQIRLFGWSPVVPSGFKNRYAYGHVVENGRHLLVSGGLGFSILPVRLGMPPEINLVEIG
ncbi:MAG: metallophosphoesterase [Pseudomonadota bacterium]